MSSHKITHAAKFVIPYLKPYKAQICVAVFALIMAAGTVLTLGWGLRNLVDRGLSGQSHDILNNALIVMIGIVLFLACASALRYFMISWLGERIVADLRQDVYAHFMKMDPSFFDRHKTGSIISRLTVDTSVIQQVVSETMSIALRNAIMLVGSFFMLLLTSPKLTGLILMIVPVVVFPLVFMGRRVRAKSRAAQESVGDLSSYIDETIHGVQTVQASGQQERVKERFNAATDTVFQAGLKYIRLRAGITAVAIFTGFGGVSLVLWGGGHDLLDGEITAGVLSSFIFYAVLMAGALGALSEVYGALSRGAGAVDQLSEVLEEKSGLETLKPILNLNDDMDGEISCEHIHFSYPARPDVTVLNDINASFPAGKVTALVGSSGAGKSTLFHLVQRFYDPAKGTVKIDDIDIRHLEIDHLRSKISTVPQDPVIFSSTIMDNIRFGRPDATEAEIIKAAKDANAHEFIMALPDGYETRLGERGSRLSGGQKQRVAIARAILRDPKILLLDEATSALDSESETKVQDALERVMKGRTTIVIAHRLSTIQNADQILVMENGQIVERGTHQELFKQKGTYFKYAEMQFEQKSA